MNPISRRKFLASVGITATSVSIAGCANGDPTETPGESPTTEQSPTGTDPPTSPETSTPTPTPTVTDSAEEEPTLIDRDDFSLELFAEFTDIEGGPADDAFQILISEGDRGFPPGMFVSGGSGSDNRLFFANREGQIRPFTDGFNGSEGMVFATDQYGDGLLVTEPRETRIRRVLEDGSVSTFAEVGTDPFGPASLAYGPHDGRLYTTDFTGRRILRVDPDGEPTEFAAYPSPGEIPDHVMVGPDAKALTADAESRFGGSFLAGTFTFGSEASGLDTLYSVSRSGEFLKPVATNLDGIELVSPSPGGAFGNGFYVATFGTSGRSNGSVSRLTPDGELVPFLRNIKAVHTAFDTSGLMGGGAFVTAMSATEDGPTKVWHITTS